MIGFGEMTWATYLADAGDTVYPCWYSCYFWLRRLSWNSTLGLYGLQLGTVGNEFLRFVGVIFGSEMKVISSASQALALHCVPVIESSQEPDCMRQSSTSHEDVHDLMA